MFKEDGKLQRSTQASGQAKFSGELAEDLFSSSPRLFLAKKIVFLDIDGVICTPDDYAENRADDGLPRFNPERVKLLNLLCALPETEVVISSTWRHFMGKEELERRLREAGFDGTIHCDWCTPDLKRGREPRGAEIERWLQDHPEVDRAIILDDETDFFEGQPVVQTDTRHGLNRDDIQRAVRMILGLEID